MEKAGVDKPTKIAEIGKPERRMFIVTFASEKEKWCLVAKARSMCMSNDGLKGCYVNPDLTKTERDHQYQLRKEVRERRRNGESVFIKRGTVVLRKQ